MPIHYNEQEKWKIFFNILGVKGIEVPKVDSEEITIKAKASQIDQLKKLLSSSKGLKSSVAHLISDDVDNQAFNAAEAMNLEQKNSNANTALLEKILHLTPKEITDKLFPSGSEHKLINSMTSIDNPETQILKLTLPQSNQLVRNAQVASLGIVQSNFNDIEHLLRLLSDEPIEVDLSADEVTSFAETIFKINGSTVELNYGRIREILQKEVDTHCTTPPVFVTVSQDIADDPVLTCIINKAQTMGYLSGIFAPLGSPAVLLGEVEEGERDAAMFAKPTPKDSANVADIPSIDLIIDVSGSMNENSNPNQAPDAPEYKKRIQNIIDTIIDSNQFWELTITTFSDEVDRPVTFSHFNTKEEIVQYIKDIEIGGRTSLHKAISDRLQVVKNQIDEKPHSTIILLTDGVNNFNPEVDEKSIITNAKSIGGHFTMYSVGYGQEYNKQFFDNIAQQTGFTHINIKDMAAMSELLQYVTALGGDTFLIKFLSEIQEEAAKLESVKAGEMAITKLPSTFSQVEQGGHKFHVGTEVSNANVESSQQSDASSVASLEDDNDSNSNSDSSSSSEPESLAVAPDFHESSSSSHLDDSEVQVAGDLGTASTSSSWISSLCVLQ